MPDSTGRIPPVAFSLSDEAYERIFGVDGKADGLDVPAQDGGGGVQAQEPPEDS